MRLANVLNLALILTLAGCRPVETINISPEEYTLAHKDVECVVIVYRGEEDVTKNGKFIWGKKIFIYKCSDGKFLRDER